MKSKKYVCIVCEYVYDPNRGDPWGDIPAGVEFDDLPDGWVCPKCDEGKSAFEEYKWNHIDFDNL